jgi:hypothetical protein
VFNYLLALNPVGREIVKIDVTNGESTVFMRGLDAFPDGIVVDPQHKHIYWTNMGRPRAPKERATETDTNLDFSDKNGSIERADFDGNGRTYLLPEGAFVTGKQLAGAWAAGRLYWADREGAAVRSVRLDGTDQRDEVLVAKKDDDRVLLRNQCVGVAIDEEDDQLYWTQKGPPNGNEGRIFRTSLRVPMAAREIELLWSGLPEPIDLDVDTSSRTIYWTDRGDPPLGNTFNGARIPPAGKPGGEITVISRGFHEAIGLAIDKETGIAYIGDLSGEIRSIDISRGVSRLLFKGAGSFTGIAGI